MRRNFSIALSVLFAAQLAFSQQAPTGYMAFMNAVGLPTKTDVQFDGHSLKPAGFPEGNYIESFGLPVGPHAFTFSNKDCTPLSQSISVAGSPAPLYVLYNAPIKQPDGTVKQTLKLLSVPGQSPAGNQRKFLALYASERSSATVNVNGAPMSIPSNKITSLPGSSVNIATDNKEPMHYAPANPGNYVVVFFDGSDNRLRQAMLQME